MRILLILRALRLSRLADHDIARARACAVWAVEAQDRADARHATVGVILARISALDARA